MPNHRLVGLGGRRARGPHPATAIDRVDVVRFVARRRFGGGGRRWCGGARWRCRDRPRRRRLAQRPASAAPPAWRGFVGVVVGNDAADGGENLLHRRFCAFAGCVMRASSSTIAVAHASAYRREAFPSAGASAQSRRLSMKAMAKVQRKQSQADNDLWVVRNDVAERAATAQACDLAAVGRYARRPRRRALADNAPADRRSSR